MRSIEGCNTTHDYICIKPTLCQTFLACPKATLLLGKEPSQGASSNNLQGTAPAFPWPRYITEIGVTLK